MHRPSEGAPITHPTIDAAARDFLCGRISRREMLRRALAAGAGTVALAGLRVLPASAQATPAGESRTPGWSITLPADLPTTMSGQSVRAVLQDPTSPDLPFVMAASAKFQDATGIKVEIVNGPTSTTDRLQAYRQQWAAQSADIDVFMIDLIWPGIVKPFAVDLSSHVQDVIGQHFPAIAANNTVAGDLVAMPWFSGAGLLYYRTDLVQKYGISIPTTYDELATAAKTVQDGEHATNPQFSGFIWQGAAYEGLTCNGLEWQVSNGGGTIVESDGTVSVNNDQAISAFERAKGWIGTVTPQAVVNYKEPEGVSAFTAGNVGFMRHWAGTHAALEDPQSSVAGRIGVSLLPKGSGGKARNADCLGGWNLMLSTFSKNQDPGIAFIRYMTSPELQLSMSVERANPSTIPTVYDDPNLAQAQPFIAQLKQIFLDGAVARPSTVTAENYADVSQIYFQQLNAILSGSTSAKDGAASMESQIKNLLTNGGL